MNPCDSQVGEWFWELTRQDDPVGGLLGMDVRM